jgi:N-acetylglutamate synthase-like GNAT family acetyltransferase
MHWTKDEFLITTDREKIDVAAVHNFLKTSYWAENISYDVVQKSITGSLCFGVFYNQQQVGFARVVTDSATFAYLADVFIIEAFRGRGLSCWLMEVILAHPQLQGLRRFLLATRDAHGLYKKFGFTPITQIEPWMQQHNPDVYKQPV